MYSSSYYASSSASSLDGGAIAVVLGFLGAYFIVILALAALMIIAHWRIFTKAGEQGWKCLIPFYSQYILCKITKTPMWVFILYCIPCLWFFSPMLFTIYTSIKLAKVFGQEGGFAVGLILLSPIFYPILAFGKSTYVGSSD